METKPRWPKRDRREYYRQRRRLQRLLWLQAHPSYLPRVKLTEEELKARRLARHKAWVAANLSYVRAQARMRKQRNRDYRMWLAAQEVDSE